MGGSWLEEGDSDIDGAFCLLHENVGMGGKSRYAANFASTVVADYQKIWCMLEGLR